MPGFAVHRGCWLALTVAVALATPAGARRAVDQRVLAAHVGFLAGDALHGRRSASPDEAVAAAYVAAQFRAIGLVPAPGQTGYLQTAQIVMPALTAPPTLTIDGAPVALTLLTGSADVRGALAVADAADIPAARVVVATGAMPLARLQHAAAEQHVALLIIPASDATQVYTARKGNPRLAPHLAGETATGMAVAVVAAADIARIARKPGAAVVLTLPFATPTELTTTNAIGFLPGTDRTAGVLLLSAHLDHLGIIDGIIMPGANDDASGVATVLELARVLAGHRLRRGLLFVAYGSEEIGEFGSHYFALHPPVPLTAIAANIEFEMVGAPDPKLPPGSMMMTGFDRSNLGAAFRRQGAVVVADPYPSEHFFERSDNYQLALAGVVAHTISGWATIPTYHQPTDTVAALDLPFMTRAVQSFVAPLHWLASKRFEPAWLPGGQPTR